MNVIHVHENVGACRMADTCRLMSYMYMYMYMRMYTCTCTYGHFSVESADVYYVDLEI